MHQRHVRKQTTFLSVSCAANPFKQVTPPLKVVPRFDPAKMTCDEAGVHASEACVGELILAFVSVSSSTCSIEMHKRGAWKYSDNGTYSGSLRDLFTQLFWIGSWFFDRINNLGAENRKGV